MHPGTIRPAFLPGFEKLYNLKGPTVVKPYAIKYGIILLNETEQRLAKYLAKKKYDTARKNGILDKQIGPQQKWEIELNGVGSELAGCKMLNIYPDLSGYPAISDGHLHNGESVDFKTTNINHGQLLVAIWKKHKPSDLYILMVGDFPEYEYKGFIPGVELFKPENIGDVGHGPTYVIPQHRLKYEI